MNSFILPLSQTAYSFGRSPTEAVFSFKILAEKAVTTCNYHIHLLLFDMSKAFDTIKRNTLLKDLEGILEEDEIFLVFLLLDNIHYSVKLENDFGPSFSTNIGSPQGDGASALFFIIYLAISLIPLKNISLKQNNFIDHLYNKPQSITTDILPNHISDHNYTGFTDFYFTLDQQYADDIGFISTGKHIVNKIERDLPNILENRNLFINRQKTEKFDIFYKCDDQWKNCKYIGSYLDTEKDYEKRKLLANATFSNLRSIFTSKRLSLHVKLRIFTALVESIFLYNSELWGITLSLENKIDSFQRRLLRNILNIKWFNQNWISNKELYLKTFQKPWSKVIAFRRLRFFGHVARLDDKTPAKLALYESLRTCKKPKGKPKTTLISTLSKQLSAMNLTFDEAILLAKNREVWRQRVLEHVYN